MWAAAGPGQYSTHSQVPYSTILTVRLLLMRERNPEDWDTLNRWCSAGSCCCCEVLR